MRSRGELTRRDVLRNAGATIAGILVGADPVTGQEAEPLVWLDMTQAKLDDAYNNRVYAPNMDRVVERVTFRNEQAKTRLGPPLEFKYGLGPMESLDVYRPDTDGGPINIYIHGGTWRFGTADQNVDLAETFVSSGANAVLLDFAAVEEVEEGLSTLIRQVRDAVAWTYRNAGLFGGDPERLFVSGHSSGGHLAAAVLTTDWQQSYGLPENLVKGGLCASGLYDLEPVRRSWRNSYLHLDDSLVQALSPIRHIDHLAAPLVVAYGTFETPEFQRQARVFAAAVEAAGKSVELLTGRGFNHFEIRETLANPQGLLGYAALEQMGLTSEAR